MPQTLTLAQLSQYSTQIDLGGINAVHQVYESLEASGYNYAGWADGVARGDALSGQAALKFMLSTAAMGLSGQTMQDLTPSQVDAIRVDMAKGYLQTLAALAEDEGGSISRDVKFDETREFHRAAFESHGLSIANWTLTTPMDIIARTQGPQAVEDLWVRLRETGGDGLDSMLLNLVLSSQVRVLTIHPDPSISGPAQEWMDLTPGIADLSQWARSLGVAWDAFNEAYKLLGEPTYRPELTGVSRTANFVDQMLQAETLGWYSELKTLQAELDSGRMSQAKFDLLTDPHRTVVGKVLAAETRAKSMGFEGDAFTDYMKNSGKWAGLPSENFTQYKNVFDPLVSEYAVRKQLFGIVFDNPYEMKSFTEEVGPDGTYVATTTYNSGDKITFVDTGHSTRITETFAAVPNYASTSIYDGEGREIGDETVYGDGSRSTHEYDLTNSESWLDIYTRYDAEGRNEETQVTMDDGSRSRYEYDTINYRVHSAVETHYDSLGRTARDKVTMDDGTGQVHEYNPDGSQSWSDIITNFDAQGRNYSSHAYHRDGSQAITAWDVNGAGAWAAVTRHYDTLGRNDATNVWLDDGTLGVNAYDVNNVQPWSWTNTQYDRQGRQELFEVTMDDRTRGVYRYDVNNSQSWSVTNTHFDAQGRNDATNVHMDDGTLSVYAYDVNNAQSWSAIQRHYDAQGREDWVNIFQDDGRRNVIDYDQAGTEGWTRLEATFGADGRQDNSTRYFDDGTRLSVENDFYGLNSNKLVGYRPDGTLFFSAQQLATGAIVNGVGYWSPNFNVDLNPANVVNYGGYSPHPIFPSGPFIIAPPGPGVPPGPGDFPPYDLDVTIKPPPGGWEEAYPAPPGWEGP